MAPATDSIMGVPATGEGWGRLGHERYDPRDRRGTRCGHHGQPGCVPVHRQGGPVARRADAGRPGTRPTRRSPGPCRSRPTSRRSGAGHVLATGAQTAFIDGIHLAVTVGAAIAAAAAVIVLRYLPHVTTHDAGRPRAPKPRWRSVWPGWPPRSAPRPRSRRPPPRSAASRGYRRRLGDHRAGPIRARVGDCPGFGA